MTETRTADSNQQKKLLYKLLKYIALGLNIGLCLCGIAFIVLAWTNTTGGTVCKTKPTIAEYTLERIDNSIKVYILDLNHYPVNLVDLYSDTGQSMWMGPYIKEKELSDPWGVPYQYQYFPERNGYQLYTLGADHKIGGTDQASDQISEASLKIIKTPTKKFIKIH